MSYGGCELGEKSCVNAVFWSARNTPPCASIPLGNPESNTAVPASIDDTSQMCLALMMLSPIPPRQRSAWVRAPLLQADQTN